MTRINKQTRQKSNKKEHLAQRNIAKQRHRQEPILERQAPTRLEKPRILVVCEGSNTEPSYFQKFRLATATIVFLGTGMNTVSLVQKAEDLQYEAEQTGKKYGQVWCVFDKDDFKDGDFNEAISRAERNGFGAAYSNQAFEYWLILHFEDHQGSSMHRDDYDGKLNSFLNPLGTSYDGKGSKKITDEIFDLLQADDPKSGGQRQDLAIRRAKRVYDLFDHSSPAKEESSTTVFRLVEEMMKYI